MINSVILLTKGLVWQMVSAHSIFRKNLFDSVLSTGEALWTECNNVQNLLLKSLCDFFSLLTDYKHVQLLKDILSSVNNWGWELWFSLRVFNLLNGFCFTRLQPFCSKQTYIEPRGTSLLSNLNHVLWRVTILTERRVNVFWKRLNETDLKLVL